jgi:hypothetical protein
MKIRLVGAELFHAGRRMDGQTDRITKLIVDFRNFLNQSKNTGSMLDRSKLNCDVYKYRCNQ